MLQQKYQIHHTTIQVEDFVEQDMSSCSRYLSCRVNSSHQRVIIELIRSTSSCVQRSSSCLKLIGPQIIFCIKNQFVSRVIRLSEKGIGSKLHAQNSFPRAQDLITLVFLPFRCHLQMHRAHEVTITWKKTHLFFKLRNAFLLPLINWHSRGYNLSMAYSINTMKIPLLHPNALSRMNT